MGKVFVSHSKYDDEFCNRFDQACASVGLERFRSEFEEIEDPAWKTINREISKSNTLFLLVGKELVNRQTTSSDNWAFTQNWISYEIGVASQQNKDVWVVCDSIPINFPVPYLTNYVLNGIHMDNPENRNFWKPYLNAYKNYKGVIFNKKYKCSCFMCGATFNLLNSLEKGAQIVCPTCLSLLGFPDGWPLDDI